MRRDWRIAVRTVSGLCILATLSVGVVPGFAPTGAVRAIGNVLIWFGIAGLLVSSFGKSKGTQAHAGPAESSESRPGLVGAVGGTAIVERHRTQAEVEQDLARRAARLTEEQARLTAEFNRVMPKRRPDQGPTG